MSCRESPQSVSFHAPTPQPYPYVVVAGPDTMSYVAVAVAPVVVDDASAGAVMVKVLALGTVSISNSFCKLACVNPPMSPLTLEMVTKSPIRAAWDPSVTVTVADPDVVPNCVMDPAPRVGVAS